MRPDLPRFEGFANADDEARWEAYRALMRKKGDAQILPGLEDEVPEEDQSFLPAEVADEPASMADEADPDEDEYAGPDDIEHPAYVQPDRPDELAAAGTLAVDQAEGELPRHARTPSAGRYARLVGATMALTAGIILAASLVQRQPEQPAVAALPHPAAPSPVASTAVASTVPAPPPHQTPIPAPTPARPIEARAAAPDLPPAPLAAEASPRHVRDAHLRPGLSTDCPQCRTARNAPPRNEAPLCWTAQTDTGLNPGSRVREVRLARCQDPA